LQLVTGPHFDRGDDGHGPLHWQVEWRLMHGVPAEEIRQLLQLARRRTFRRGEVVVHREDPADSLHLISKGRFAIRVMTPHGEQSTIAVRGPGDSFGEMALVGAKGRRSATVEALEEAETFCVFEDDFARLRREHSAVSEAVIEFLVDEIRTLNERLLEALYVSAERRVLRRVAELADVYAAGVNGEVQIQLTQEELAGLAGTSRATVNAVLRDAQERGLLALGRGRVAVRDGDELTRRAR
jgi:CRP/FNR family transcriptional regulator, cyclic AMP receptor protein